MKGENVITLRELDRAVCWPHAANNSWVPPLTFCG